MMDPLDPGDPSIVLAAYATHDGDRELLLLALPGGLWLLDGRRAPDPFDDDERLLAAALPSEQVACGPRIATSKPPGVSSGRSRPPSRSSTPCLDDHGDGRAP